MPGGNAGDSSTPREPATSLLNTIEDWGAGLWTSNTTPPSGSTTHHDAARLHDEVRLFADGTRRSTRSKIRGGIERPTSMTHLNRVTSLTAGSAIYSWVYGDESLHD